MSQPASNLRHPADLPSAIADVPLLDGEPGASELEVDDAEDDPYRYGWRGRWAKSPDGSRKLRLILLTCEDPLDPQAVERVPEGSIQREVPVSVTGSPERCQEDDTTVTIW